MKNGKETKMDLMVMENLLFGKNISRTYDLKGAIYSRHISSSDSSKDLDQVYLDQNFIDDLRVSPFYVGVKTKHLLQRAIWNDTTFLTVSAGLFSCGYNIISLLNGENHTRALLHNDLTVHEMDAYTKEKEEET